MSFNRTSLTSRNEQVIYPNFTPRLISAINLAIYNVWTEIALKYNLNELSEDAITVNLQKKLDDLRRSRHIPNFNEDIFETIDRGSQFKSFDGSSLTKSPDLLIRCRANASIYDGLFFECKLIRNSKHHLEYVENGLYRYINGLYAWAKTEAVMIAYVSDGSLPANSLKKTFANHSHKEEFRLCKPVDNKYLNQGGSDTKIKTRHRRNLSYDYNHPIDVYHLWLKC